MTGGGLERTDRPAAADSLDEEGQQKCGADEAKVGREFQRNVP